jgi:DNA repair protein RadA/Sms
VIGWDSGRLAMLLAVLEARCGLSLAASDIYLNVAGGFRIGEPAADLAVAAALISASADLPTQAGEVYFGEVGLSGEVRAVGQAEPRLKEAAKLGFGAACMPPRAARTKAVAVPGITGAELGHLADLVARFYPERAKRARG